MKSKSDFRFRGHLVRDPKTVGESSVVTTIALNKYYNGENHTEYADVWLHGKTADYVTKYCRKGNYVEAEGDVGIKSNKLDDGKYETKVNFKAWQFDKLEKNTETETENAADLPF